MRSFFQELLNSLRNNVLRTVLTGSTIAWGILLLVVLLGVGDGMQNGIYQTAQETGLGDIESSLELRPTQLPYGGYQKEREQVLKHRRILDTLGVGFALALMIIQWGNPALSLAFQAFVIWLIPSQLYDLWQKFNVSRGVLFACAIALIVIEFGLALLP